jgi:hypothetical protein
MTQSTTDVGIMRSTVDPVTQQRVYYKRYHTVQDALRARQRTSMQGWRRGGAFLFHPSATQAMIDRCVSNKHL